MRGGAFIIAASLLAMAGCQQQHAAAPAPTTQPLAEIIDRYYEPSEASALVFTPAVAIDGPDLDLSRDQREPGAFVGFEDVEQTFVYVRTDDRQESHGLGRFERQAITEKVGSSTR